MAHLGSEFRKCRLPCQLTYQLRSIGSKHLEYLCELFQMEGGLEIFVETLATLIHSICNNITSKTFKHGLIFLIFLILGYWGEGYMFAVCGIGAFFLRFRGFRDSFLRFCGFSKTVAVCGFGLICVRFCGMNTF